MGRWEILSRLLPLVMEWVAASLPFGAIICSWPAAWVLKVSLPFPGLGWMVKGLIFGDACQMGALMLVMGS